MGEARKWADLSDEDAEIMALVRQLPPERRAVFLKIGAALADQNAEALRVAARSSGLPAVIRVAEGIIADWEAEASAKS